MGKDCEIQISRLVKEVAESLLWVLAKRMGDVTGSRTGKGYCIKVTRYRGWGKDGISHGNGKLKVVRVKPRDLRLSKEAR